MKTLFIGIIGFSVMVVLVKVILPDGKMNKVACIAISFIFCLSLLVFFGGQKAFDIDYENISLDYDMNYEILHKKRLIKYICTRLLNDNEIDFTDVQVELSENGEPAHIYITLPSDSIYTEQEHIDLIDNIKEVLSGYFNISSDRVTVNE